MNATATFDTTGTADSDGSIVSRAWNYGDGRTGTTDVHVYAASGTFTATYTVTDNTGGSASTTVSVAVAKCSAAGLASAALSPHTTVCVQSSRGEMVFEIYTLQAPVTAANFMKYVNDGFFGGTIFHRVIPGFVLQGGGFTPGMVAKTQTYPAIALESSTGLKNWRYTLAMARTSAPNSATSQFFVNLVDNAALDYNPANALPNGYAVFGQVIHGTAVVDAMANVATGAVAGFLDVPVDDIVIRGMVRVP